MKIVKFAVMGYLLSFVVISAAILPFASAGGLIDMAFGRDIKSDRSKEPIKPIPINFDNNRAKTDLGKRLFFEPRLSKSGWITCNSCHNLSTGGADNLPTSIGHKWMSGSINSPTVLNSKFNLAQFWDGRARDLKEQAKGPIANPMEMASSHDLAVEVLQSIPEYVKWFKEVYGEEGITIDTVADAIAAFEETLTTPNARFDLWLRGYDRISKTEEEGYALFKEKGCIVCHNGVGVGGGSFQKFGIAKPYEKDTGTLGRYNVTKAVEDKYVFKVPLLRNIELTAPYFHDASTWRLAEAVQVMAAYQLGIKLTEDETNKIVAFLKTLTGDRPEIIYPVLPPSNVNTPQPNRN
ncbi:cytochrome c551 peroxidase [Candidatus Kuenenia stuttgartiensis]|jgi:cytochrome c peroxidase|uniref:Cytochrome c551 peroxidase n=3 Tax=Candidatus Brocadiaceae TaxID=1127830 RepID=Q1PZY5_KUEST|nr:MULTISPECIES: cytochrome-c peroxidase [Kuenenia]MBE7546589.1 cytochrome-c peroxidase [Planctomycetia bacterium]QII09970.1 cytochrome c551 peroxidase [Candidatus Kuenenia stuttgartiensis]CAJ72649.1 strongly similar to cytochrome c peroxidase [Candidatus Kuenenia stuttgartiensis]SOH04171.1 strongly similar to cytochrome c peroxidase [Candidatus Kuenenia stuttgartiensis]GJQ47682.1 MAG: cytochrome b6 [Candidatus Kuenenia stuttgartiensis]